MSKNNVYILGKITLIFLLSLILSCSDTTTKNKKYRRPASHEVKPIATPEPVSTAPTFTRKPWESWSYDRDLQGAPTTQPQLLKGDHYLQNGARAQALTAYREALATPGLSPNDREAAVVRIAGCELAFDQPDAALYTMSNYFRTVGVTPAAVPAPFALMFGYSYGRKGDFDQAISWFNQSAHSTQGTVVVTTAADEALRALISSIPDAQLEEHATKWRTEDTVAKLFAEVRGMRANGITSGSPAGNAFASLFTIESGAVVPVGQGDVPQVAGAGRIVLLLPTSGSYAELGNSVREGFELAYEGQKQAIPTLPEFVVQDSMGDPERAKMSLLDTTVTGKPVVVIGPILAEESRAAAAEAERAGVPLLSFSKRSDFPTSSLVYRLAPTFSLQMKTLLKGVETVGQIKRVALLYPTDGNSGEMAHFLKEKLTAAHLSVVYESAYPKGDGDALLTRAREVEKLAIDGVLFSGALGDGVQFFSSIAESKRKKMRPLALANWDSPQELMNSATVLNGAIYVSPFFRSSTRPLVKQFIAAYRAKFGKDPDFLAAQGFDAGTVILSAIARATSQGITLAEALQLVGVYDGIMGTMRHESGGEIQIDFSPVELLDGELREIEQNFRLPEPALGSDVISSDVTKGSSTEDDKTKTQ